MVASITDKFMKLGTRGARTTLASPGKSPSDTSVTLTSPAEWQIETAITLGLYIEDPTTHQEQPNSYTVWKGTLAGSTVTGLVKQYGPDGMTYPAGSIAVMHISSAWGNSLVDGILVAHNQDGTLKDSIVTTTKLASKAATLAKIDGGTTDGVLQTDASGNVTSSLLPASKVDFTTFPYIQVNRTTNYNHGSGAGTLPFNNVYDSRAVAGKLSLAGDGSITVGSGVTKVRVSGSVMSESLVGNYLFISARKNTTDINQVLSAKSAGNYAGIVLPSLIISVTSGDTIKINYDSNGTSTVRGQYSMMLVEVVG